MKNKFEKTIVKLANASFKDGRLLESQVAKSIKALKHLPRNESILALTQYLKLIKRKERAHTMILETSIPISSAQIQKVKKIADKKFKITKVIHSINPEILGGLKLRVGDEVWDETLLNKIDQVKEAIVHGRPN